MLPLSLPAVEPWSANAPLPAAPPLEMPEPGGGPVEPDEPEVEDPGLEEPDEPEDPDDPAEPEEPVPLDDPATPSPATPSPGILIGRKESLAAI